MKGGENETLTWETQQWINRLIDVKGKTYTKWNKLK